jgi:hypothetical protein
MNFLQFNKKILAIALVIATLAPSVALAAYKVEDLPGTMVNHDFVIGPGKIEVEVNPGESVTKNILVTNRMGETKKFQISVEDFTGSRNTAETVVLLGDEHGPYSLRDYIKVPEWTFELKQGQRATVPVTISIPKDAEPGGRYGSVLISIASRQDGEGDGLGSASIVSRIGSLIFVTIPGEAKEEGRLTEFTVAGHKSMLGSGPVNFQLLYENNGSVYVNPYGKIRIANMFGAQVGDVEVKPWFAMPNSLRLREVTWTKEMLFGRYTAEAMINRGYGDIIDRQTVSFWVIPWKYLAAAFGCIVLIVLIVLWIGKNFEFKRKE